MTNKLDFDLNFLDKNSKLKHPGLSKNNNESDFDRENRETLKAAGIVTAFITAIVLVIAYVV